MNIYRGFSKLEDLPYVKNTRKNRIPKNLNLRDHKLADQIFYEKFGIRFRSQSVFCTGDISSAKCYGDVAIIKPIGNYKICWSPICHDFIEVEQSHLNIIDFIEENRYKIGDLKEALDSGNEIMLFCERYKVLSSV